MGSERNGHTLVAMQILVAMATQTWPRNTAQLGTLPKRYL